MGILVESGDRKITRANPVFHEIFGIPQEQSLEGLDCEIAANNSAQLFSDPEGFIKRIEEILQNKKIVKNDKLGLKDGRCLERDFVPVFKDDEFIGNMWIYRDITEKEAMYNKLYESESQYKLISENTTDGIALLENDKVVYVSEGYLKMLGYSQEELLSVKFDNLFDNIHPDDRERAHRTISESRKNGEKNLQLETRLLRKDGSYVWVEDKISRVFNEEGKHISSVIHSRDIMDRKLAEMKLSVSRERFRSLIANMEEGLVLHDPTGKIVESNEKARDILELTADMLEGKSPMEFEYATIKEDGSEFPHDQHPASITLQQGKPVKNVIMGIRKSDSHTVWIKINSEPLFFDNEKPYAMVTFSDITSLKQKEQELINLNSKKDRLISIIGHDLRNPIQAMKSLSELVKISIDSNDFEGLKDLSRLLSQSADVSLDLINDLLDWGKMETESDQNKNMEVDLNKLIENNFTLFRYPIQNKKLRTEISIEGNHKMKCNKFIIDLVLRNLTSNAVKFTPENGRIIVKGKPVSDNYYECKVSDTGVGIEKQYLEKLFDIQEKISTKGTNNEKGSGLGLVLCYDYIHKIGGQIHVTSKKGEGTTFSVLFPFTFLKESGLTKETVSM